MNNILKPPPITAEKNGVKTCSQIPETKWPSKALGMAISVYFNDVLNKLNLSVGTAFLIVLILRIEVSPMHIKKEIETALILSTGVSANKPINKRTEPKQ